MGPFGNISGRDAVKAFEKIGWVVKRQKGSHVILAKEGREAHLSVPQHKELATGTVRSLIAASGLTVAEFLELLQK